MPIHLTGEAIEGEALRPVLFIDRAIQGNILIAELRKAGARIELHRDHFADDAADIEWIPEVSQRGWFVLTRDARLRYNPLEIQVLKASVLGTFVFVPSNLKGIEIARIVVGALPSIEIAALNTPRPFIIRIYRDGALKILDLNI